MPTLTDQKHLLLEAYYVGRHKAKALLTNIQNHADTFNCHNQNIEEDYTFSSAITFLNFIIHCVFNDYNIDMVNLASNETILKTLTSQVEEAILKIDGISAKFNAVFRNMN